jgi:pyridinium-3,5-biscarboxylic acid mononucleotide synthase
VDRATLTRILRRVKTGRLSVAGALEEMRLAPIDRLEFATLDLHRAIRRGCPEVVFGAGKSPAQIAAIVSRFSRAGQSVLVTRAGPEAHAAVAAVAPQAEYHALARAITVRLSKKKRGRPGITVITAGTSDLPVAEEAVVTAEFMGHAVKTLVDVGIAGVHRLLAHRRILITSRVIVVVAGMEGALPSLVSGLTDCPVIGVPTSIGYGSGAGGQAALLAMLNSCSAGLTVVNVDNGFGAGYAAALINQSKGRSR